MAWLLSQYGNNSRWKTLFRKTWSHPIQDPACGTTITRLANSENAADSTRLTTAFFDAAKAD
jgi:hypothetical protein